MRITFRIAKPILTAIIAAVLLALPNIKVPYIDRHTESYFQSAISQATVAYGVCRGLNAAVSVIKASQIQIEPAGLGVSLAAGQVLDPLDDMTERASDVLVTAIVSLGIQEIAYEISVSFAPPLMGAALLLYLALGFFKPEKTGALQSVIWRGVVMMAIARFCLPAASLVSNQLQDHFFNPKIVQAREGMAMGLPDLEKIKDVSLPKVDGVLGTIENGFGFVEQKTAELASGLKTLAKNMTSVVGSLLKITSLYVAIFIFNVICLPILAFWLLVKVVNALFTLNMPVMINLHTNRANPD